MTSVASQSYIKDVSVNSSDQLSLASITSLERHALQYQTDVERFADPSLNKQKFLVSDDKKDEIATLAVCAKLEKAIGRRLSLQDASFTRKQAAQAQAQAAAQAVTTEPKAVGVMSASKTATEKTP